MVRAHMRYPLDVGVLLHVGERECEGERGGGEGACLCCCGVMEARHGFYVTDKVDCRRNRCRGGARK